MIDYLLGIFIWKRFKLVQATKETPVAVGVKGSVGRPRPANLPFINFPGDSLDERHFLRLQVGLGFHLELFPSYDAGSFQVATVHGSCVGRFLHPAGVGVFKPMDYVLGGAI